MDENWYTGIFYKVKGTGRVGEQIIRSKYEEGL